MQAFKTIIALKLERQTVPHHKPKNLPLKPKSPSESRLFAVSAFFTFYTFRFAVLLFLQPTSTVTPSVSLFLSSLPRKVFRKRRGRNSYIPKTPLQRCMVAKSNCRFKSPLQSRLHSDSVTDFPMRQQPDLHSCVCWHTYRTKKRTRRCDHRDLQLCHPALSVQLT